MLEYFYEPEIKTELTLLKILDHQDKWTSLQELQVLSGLSRPTIIKYLNNIVELSSKYESFSLKKNIKEEYHLEISDNFQYGQYYRNQLYKMWPIQFISELLLKKHVVKNNFIASYFISESLLKKKIATIKEIVRLFKLELITDAGNYHLVGEESNIRRLAKDFFWEFFKGSAWPFELINEDKVINKAKTILNDRYIKLSLIDQRKIHYQLAIQETRNINGFFYEIQPHLVPLIPTFGQITEDLYSTKKIFHSRNELYYFYFLLSTNSNFYSFFNFKSRISNTNCSQLTKLSRTINNVNDYINCNIQNMSAEKSQLFSDFIVSTYIKLELYNNAYFLSSYSFKRYKSKKLKHHLDRILAIVNTQFSLQNDAIDYLYYHFELIMLQVFPPSVFESEIKIGFCTDLNIAHEQYLIELLKVYFSAPYNVQFTSDFNINHVELDLVIHTSLSPENFLKKNIKQTCYIDIRNLYQPEPTELLNLITKYISKISENDLE